jgi:hypothetical protein
LRHNLYLLISSQSDFGRFNQRAGYTANFKLKCFNRDFGNNGSHQNIGRHFQRNFRYDIAMIYGFNDALPLITVTELHGVVSRIVGVTILISRVYARLKYRFIFLLKQLGGSVLAALSPSLIQQYGLFCEKL